MGMRGQTRDPRERCPRESRRPTTTDTELTIYGVSRHQRKVLPASPSCRLGRPLPRGATRRKPSAALSTHCIRNLGGTARSDAFGTNASHCGRRRRDTFVIHRTAESRPLTPEDGRRAAVSLSGFHRDPLIPDERRSRETGGRSCWRGRKKRLGV